MGEQRDGTGQKLEIKAGSDAPFAVHVHADGRRGCFDADATGGAVVDIAAPQVGAAQQRRQRGEDCRFRHGFDKDQIEAAIIDLSERVDRQPTGKVPSVRHTQDEGGPS